MIRTVRVKHMNVSREGLCGVREVARELWRAVESFSVGRTKTWLG
jgi:hypothetical protein